MCGQTVNRNFQKCTDSAALFIVGFLLRDVNADLAISTGACAHLHDRKLGLQYCYNDEGRKVVLIVFLIKCKQELSNMRHMHNSNLNGEFIGKTLRFMQVTVFTVCDGSKNQV
jgi:hypothetical protein